MKPSVISQIASEITSVWQVFHAQSDAKTHVVFGVKSLVILLENAFPPAERKLAFERKSSPRLQQYIAAVLKLACESQIVTIERILQEKVVYSGQSMDLKTGWVMCIFQVGTQPG